jgi:hypothetical protein
VKRLSLIAALATLVIWAVVPPAAAQVTRAVDVSVAAGAAYDENVFARPTASSDHVYRISPTLSLQQNTVRSEMRLAASTDAEWFSRYSVLSTLAARQVADALWSWRASDADTLGFTASYDSSVNPSELNRETGLFVGRIRAWRWSGAPSYTRALGARSAIEASYKLTGEFAATLPDTITQAGEIAFVEQLGPRDELRPTYIAEFYQFRADPAAPEGTAPIATSLARSHRGVLRWTHRLTPSVRMVVAGGARFAESRATPEVEFRLDRRAGFFVASGSYTWGRVTTLGLAKLVDVHNALVSLAYARPKSTEISIGGGFFRSTLDALRADVYYGDASVQIPIARPLFLRVTTSLDYQRGRVTTLPIAPVELLTETPLAITSPGLPPGPVRRSTVFVAFVLVGSSHSAAGPAPEPPGSGIQRMGAPR